MNATSARATRLLALSLAVYRALLLLYPTRFRRAYATQMEQVFHMSCQQACRSGGALALAHVWRVTLGDLIVTALAEHIEEVTVMERRSLSRAAGLAGLIGGALLLLYGASELVYYAPDLANAILNPLRDPVAPWLALAQVSLVPLAWICVIVGLLGLYAFLAQQRSGMVWFAGAIAIVGACLGFFGSFSLLMAGWGSWNPTDLSIAHYYQLSGSRLPYLGALDLYGRILLGLGLLLTPIMLQRGVALGRLRVIIVTLGGVALIPYLYVYLAVPNYLVAHLSSGTKGYGVYPPLPQYPFSLPLPWGNNLLLLLLGIEIAFAIIWGIGLLLLGARFLRDEQRAAAQPIRPAPALS